MATEITRAPDVSDETDREVAAKATTGFVTGLEQSGTFHMEADR